MDLIIAIGIFITVVLLLEAIHLIYRAIRNPELKRMQKQLKQVSAEEYFHRPVDITKKRSFSKIPWLNRLLTRIPNAQVIDRFLKQADPRYQLGFFILITFLIAIVGFYISLQVTRDLLISVIVAILTGLIPFIFVYLKRNKRMHKFERQLPEALDSIARSLRAGHSFAGGMKIVAEEFEDPLGSEFSETFNEINFGVSVIEALKNLVDRVACPDLRFFAISVIIQRDTGGNLAEILENISHLIRERFKLQGRIRALSAEGKLSAIVLIILPFFVAFMIYMLNPVYITRLIIDPVGKILVTTGIFLMIIGAFVMKRLIMIKV